MTRVKFASFGSGNIERTKRVLFNATRFLYTRKRCVMMNDSKPRISVVSVVENLATALSDTCKLASFVQVNQADISVESLQDSEIIVGDPPLLAPVVFQLPKLKWVQSTYAGCDALIENMPHDKEPSFVVTKLGNIFGPVMAEYVVGHIIARERKFSMSWQCQKEKVWLPYQHWTYRPLSEISIGIIGFGNIGQSVGKSCKSMGMTVNVVQRESSSGKLPFVDNSFTLDELAECLKQCDFFCNVLPSTPKTRGLFSGDVLENCKEKKTVFINIGRGDVIDEGSILKALDNHWIGGAILDVLEVEPLPPTSPLWSHPEVVITPHVSGLFFGNELVQGFAENFPNYQSGKPMKYILDWKKGY